MKLMLITGALMLASGLGHSLTVLPGHPVNGWTLVMLLSVALFFRAWWYAEVATAHQIEKEDAR